MLKRSLHTHANGNVLQELQQTVSSRTFISRCVQRFKAAENLV